MDQAETSLAFGNRIKTIDPVEFPSSFGSAKVSPAIFTKVPSEAWVKRSGPGFIRAVVDMKQRNSTWGCSRIAEQIALAFGVSINKDVVRLQPNENSQSNRYG